MRQSLLISILILMGWTASAQQNTCIVKLLNLPEHELSPGISGNFAVQIENLTDSSTSYLIKSTIPRGWSEIMNYCSVLSEAKSKSFKINSFYIPESAQVGSYPIYVDVYHKPTDSLVSRDSFFIAVKANYELRLTPIQSSDVLFAGDSMTVAFVLHNKSNLPVSSRVIIINGPVTEQRYYTLKPDTQISDKILIISKKDVDFAIKKNVLVTAEIPGHRECNQQISFVYDILPVKQQKFDVYERFPVKISGLVASNNDRAERLYSSMYDISAAGWLSEEKKRFLTFQFKGPDRRGDPILGTQDSYSLRYTTRKHFIHLGDNSFNLTKLTESGRMARGAEYRFSMRKISVGAWAAVPRFYPQLKWISAAWVELKPRSNLLLQTGIIHKEFTSQSPADLLSVSGVSASEKYGSYDAELALGMQDQQLSTAMQVKAKWQRDWFRIQTAVTWADKNFPGYYSNTSNLSGGLGFRVTKNLQVNMSYLSNNSNLALDTMYANAPYTSIATVNMNYRITDALNLSIDGSYRKQQDRMPVPAFYYDEEAANAGFSLRFSQFDLSLTGGYGKILNYLPSTVGQSLNSAKGNLNFRVNLSPKFSLEGFAYYQGNQHYLIPEMQDVYYGGGVKYTSNTIRFQAKYQSNYLIEEFYKDRSILNAGISIFPADNHELSAVASYNLIKNTFDQKVFRFYIKYTYTLQMPVRRKKDIGSLEGQIINNGIPSVAGMVISFGGNSAITDEQGKFYIPVVKAGENYLFINDSKAGLHAIPETPGPYKITILPGTTNIFQLTYTRSSSISGKILIEEDEQTDGRTYITYNQKFENVILEVSKDEEVFRVISDEQGEFSFNDLRPGEWNMKIYKNGIPAGYELLSDQFTISLKAAENRTIEVKVKKMARKVKFQQQFTR